MIAYKDRIVLDQCGGRVKLVVFSRAFAGAPYVFYLLGYSCENASLEINPSRMSFYQVGSVPSWKLVRTTVSIALETVSLMIPENEVSPKLDFSNFPFVCPLEEGFGWIDITKRVLQPTAIRQSPIRILNSNSGSRDCLLACVTREGFDQNKVAYVSHGFCPSSPDLYLPKFDYEILESCVRELEDAHPAGFS
jgi:hypothetical protein